MFSIKVSVLKGNVNKQLSDGWHEVCVCRVSSILNRDVKQFGKKHMFDNDDETCWNSDQVRNSSIVVIRNNLFTVLSDHVW